MNRLQTFIEHLRVLDEPAKRTWVFVLSGVTMVFVVMLWVIYVDATVARVPGSLLLEEKVAVATSQEAGLPPQHQLLGNFKRNASLIYKNLEAMISSLVSRGNEIEIEK